MKRFFTISRQEVIAIVGGTFLIIFALACLIIFPTNEMDNRNLKKQIEMEEITLEWGRLAPFPSATEDFMIWTEGNSFSRTFKGSFTSSPTELETWIQKSPGLQDAEVEQISESTQRYIISPGAGASYAEVIINATTGTVEFRVSWS